MKDKNKTKEQLIKELAKWRKRVAKLEALKTKRKQVEDKYQKEHELFSAIYNSSKDAITHSNLEGVLLGVNGAFYKLTGYSKKELLSGKKYQDLTPDEYHEYEAKIINRIVRTGRHEEYEKEYIKKDATRVPVLLTTFVLKGNDGRPIGLAAIIKDITECKRVEEKLRESEEKYRLVVETCPDAVTTTDLDGLINFASQRTIEMHGYKNAEELLGKNILELIVPKEHEKAIFNLKRTMEEGIVKDEQYTFQRKDGSRFPAELSSVLIKDRSGKPIGFIAITKNISERKRVEQALREREKELKIKSSNLEEVNTALKVLLKRREEDKAELEENILFNISELVEPYLEKLKNSGLRENQKAYLGILKSNLDGIISPFSRRISSKHFNFTPGEIRVANLVKQGKTSKEIAELLRASPATIAFHRGKIRKKLGLKGKKTNLLSYLLSSF